MNVFYIPGAAEGLTTLPEDESKHCVKVLRMTEGERFCVTNGEGFLFDAELVEALPKRATVNLTNKREGYDHWGFNLEIAIAPTKLNERTEWFLEKATEIGIDKVRLFTSYHSERRAANVERFQKVMVAAMKQSIKSRLPKVEDLVPFDKLVKQPFDGQKFIAWIDDDVKDCLCDLYNKGENALVLIGPEGDFSPEEVALATPENGQKEELVRQLISDGHQIGNHSWEHLNFSHMSEADIRADVEKSRRRLAEVTGQEDFLVRTPYGVRTEAALAAIDSPLILWSQDPAEGQLVSGAEMARRVIRGARDGDIVLLHDSTQDNLDAACAIIDALQKRGFRFVTVDELFAARGVPPEDGVIYKSLPPK